MPALLLSERNERMRLPFASRYRGCVHPSAVEPLPDLAAELSFPELQLRHQQIEHLKGAMRAPQLRSQSVAWIDRPVGHDQPQLADGALRKLALCVLGLTPRATAMQLAAPHPRMLSTPARRAPV